MSIYPSLYCVHLSFNMSIHQLWLVNTDGPQCPLIHESVYQFWLVNTKSQRCVHLSSAVVGEHRWPVVSTYPSICLSILVGEHTGPAQCAFIHHCTVCIYPSLYCVHYPSLYCVHYPSLYCVHLSITVLCAFIHHCTVCIYPSLYSVHLSISCGW